MARVFPALAVSLSGRASGGYASAAEPMGPSVYLEGGQTVQQGSDTRTATIGLRLPAPRTFWEGRVALAEVGVGIAYLNAPYQTANKSFSMRWNFSDHLGLGRSFGADRRQELGVNVKHVSNAGCAARTRVRRLCHCATPTRSSKTSSPEAFGQQDEEGGCDGANV